jgi:hypothetical protein
MEERSSEFVVDALDHCIDGRLGGNFESQARPENVHLASQGAHVKVLVAEHAGQEVKVAVVGLPWSREFSAIHLGFHSKTDQI